MKSLFNEITNWFDLFLNARFGFFLISKFFSPQLIKIQNRFYHTQNSHYPPKRQDSYSYLLHRGLFEVFKYVKNLIILANIKICK
jgi:hypothetical protein